MVLRVVPRPSSDRETAELPVETMAGTAAAEATMARRMKNFIVGWWWLLLVRLYGSRKANDGLFSCLHRL